MAISVTCSCGARLEIDEKFLGKEVPCPDCQRPLPTTQPAGPPPLSLPDHRRVSGLASLSLALALAGAFTIVGTLAAVVVGVLALRGIARRPTELEGAGFARAGIMLGGGFTFLTLALLVSPVVFVDVFMRELVWVGRIEYSKDATLRSPSEDVAIKCPPLGLWGKYLPSLKSRTSDLLIIVDVADDAFIACQSANVDGLVPEALDERKKKVLEHFYKSELVSLLGHLGDKPLNREGTILEEKAFGTEAHDILLDLRLGGIDRRFLIRFPTKGHDKLNFVVAGARKNQFDRFQEEFRTAFESVTP